MKRRLASLVRGLPALLALPIVSAQAPSRFLLEGSALPGGQPGEVLDELSGISVDRSGSIAVLMDTSLTPFLNRLIWGSLGGSPHGVLRRPDPSTNGITNYFVQEVGVNASELIHVPAFTGAVEVRVDDRTVMTFGAPSTVPPGLWDNWVAHTGITRSGEPFTVARWEDPTSGSILGTGLFLGDPLQPILMSGTGVPGLPGTIDQLEVGTVRVSDDGTHHIGVARLDCPSCTAYLERQVPLLDGLPVMAGGAPIRGLQPVPASIGGIGESWAGCNSADVISDGRYWIGGWTQRFNTGESSRGFIFRDGDFWLRAGDPIDGGTFVYARCGLLTEDGLLVHMSTFVDASGATQDGIFVETKLLHATSQPVDWTMNGIANPDYITRFMRPSLSRPDYFAVSDEEIFYFGTVSVPSGDLRQGYFRLPYREGQNYCAALPNSTGAPASMGAYGTDDASENQLGLTADRLPPGAVGYFIAGDQQASVPMAGGSSGVLCVGGTLGRFVGPGQVQMAGPGGSMSIGVDLTQHPTAAGPITVTAGQTWNYSAWFRDVSPTGMPTSHFADGISITFR